jgi:hypothetical protein
MYSIEIFCQGFSMYAFIRTTQKVPIQKNQVASTQGRFEDEYSVTWRHSENFFINLRLTYRKMMMMMNKNFYWKRFLNIAKVAHFWIMKHLIHYLAMLGNNFRYFMSLIFLHLTTLKHHHPLQMTISNIH